MDPRRDPAGMEDLLQTRVLVRDRPRKVVLPPAPGAATHALVCEYDNACKSVSLRMDSADELFGQELRPLGRRPVHGCLGVTEAGGEAFLVVVTGVAAVGELCGRAVYRIVQVRFVGLSSGQWDEWVASDGPLPGADGGAEAVAAHPCEPLRRLLELGTFYFAPRLDLTRPLARALASDDPVDPRASDGDFWWNGHLGRAVLQAAEWAGRGGSGPAGLLLVAVQGYAGWARAAGGAGLWLVSRLGCRRAGARFLARGVDDAGHVANYCESELVAVGAGAFASFVQVRGTVPVFWEQSGVQFGHRITLSRGDEATRAAAARHLDWLAARHGRVHVVSLLGRKPGGSEAALGDTFRAHFDAWARERSAKWVAFDLNEKCRGRDFGGLVELLDEVRPLLDALGCTVASSTSGKPVCEQTGVVRTNCVDCLDRTNVAQKLFAEYMAAAWLLPSAAAGVPTLVGDEPSLAVAAGSGVSPVAQLDAATAAALSRLWAENGDAISLVYAGTGALKGGVTRSGKQTVLGLLSDVARTANRFVINNFQDRGRQDAIDALLGVAGPSAPAIVAVPAALVRAQAAAAARSREFTKTERATICVLSFNAGGALPDSEAALVPWIRRAVPDGAQVVIVALQEMIAMNAAGLAAGNGSSDQLVGLWALALRTALQRAFPTRTLVVVRAIALVGLGLVLLADETAIGRITRVERAAVKTGLGGIAGNKGAVALAFSYADSRICAIGCHLAAGDRADDRVRDCLAIAANLSFPGAGALDAFDALVWAGDFNFRLALPAARVRELISRAQFAELGAADELLRARNAFGNPLRTLLAGLAEGPLQFAPTYKFDVGADAYDSRPPDRARTPAWTDRVLFRLPPGGALVAYNSCPDLRISDHRPVHAVLDVPIAVIDHVVRLRVERECLAAEAALSADAAPVAVRLVPPALPPRPPADLIDLSGPVPLGQVAPLAKVAADVQSAQIARTRSLLDAADDEWGDFAVGSFESAAPPT